MFKMQVPGGAPVFISCDAGLADIQCDRLLLKGAYSVLAQDSWAQDSWAT